jgi:hypothetical protein
MNKGLQSRSLVTEKDFWRRCVRKTLQGKALSEVIRQEAK